MNYHFNVEVAKEHGVDAAIFLENLNFWTLKNVANKSHFKDERFWIYNTQEAWTILFPFWSRQSIRRIISYCVKNNLIVQGNYNKKNYDKTIWYSLSDQCLPFFPTLKAAIDATKSLGWNQPRAVDNFEKPWLESTNGLVGINQAIPDNKPDNKQKSFCDEQKLNSPLPPQTSTPKTKADWKAENAKVHEFAQSKDQMANEAKHIAEHEAIKRSPMPDYLKEKIGKLKLGIGGDHDDRAKKDRSLQKHVV